MTEQLILCLFTVCNCKSLVIDRDSKRVHAAEFIWMFRYILKQPFLGITVYTGC